MEQMGIYREGEFPLERQAQLGMFGGYFYINLSHMRLMTLRLGGSAESADAAWVGSRADVPPYVAASPRRRPGAVGEGRGHGRRGVRQELVGRRSTRHSTGVGAPRCPAGPGRDARHGAGQVRAEVPAGAGAGLDLARLLRRCRPASARACWPAWRQRQGRRSCPWTSSPVLATWSPPPPRRRCGTSPGR